MDCTVDQGCFLIPKSVKWTCCQEYCCQFIQDWTHGHKSWEYSCDAMRPFVFSPLHAAALPLLIHSHIFYKGMAAVENKQWP